MLFSRSEKRFPRSPLSFEPHTSTVATVQVISTPVCVLIRDMGSGIVPGYRCHEHERHLLYD
jgi:hypothetical protein